MSFEFGRLIEALQLKSRALWPAVVLSGLLVFAPEALVRRLHLETFRSDYGSWAGIVLVTGGAILAWDLINYAWTRFTEVLDRRRRKRARAATIAALTTDEMCVLARYMHYGRASIAFSLTGGVPGALRNKGILTISSTLSRADSMEFTMHPWVRDFLSKNPQLWEPCVPLITDGEY